MYRVFADPEIETWKDWTRALTGAAPAGPPPATTTATPGEGADAAATGGPA
jgi:hypothetical protein